MKDTQSILALIQLIEDPDEHIFEHVRDQLMQIGPYAIPFLENSWEFDDYGLLFQSRIEQIIHEIQFEEVKTQLTLWTNSFEKDLLEAAIIIARYQYPGLDEEEIYHTIQQIRQAIWLEINVKQTIYEKIRIFNRIFFGMFEFHVDTKHFHSPMNSYINTVIESRKGNPLSLSLIYSIIAQSLDIPVYGVNLPNQFILACMDEHHSGQHLEDRNKYGVLFYINTFAKGSLINEKAIEEFLDGLKIPHKRDYFEPCSNTAVIRRMVTNLIASFQQAGNSEKVNELQQLRAILG